MANRGNRAERRSVERTWEAFANAVRALDTTRNALQRSLQESDRRLQLYERSGSTAKAASLRQRIARNQKRLEATTAFAEEIAQRAPWAALDAWRAAVDNRALAVAVDALTELLRTKRPSYGSPAEWTEHLRDERSTLAQDVSALARDHWSMAPDQITPAHRARRLIKALCDEDILDPLFGTTARGSGPRRTAQLAVSQVSGLSERLVKALARRDGPT